MRETEPSVVVGTQPASVDELEAYEFGSSVCQRVSIAL
jgi:hypothetical protein